MIYDLESGFLYLLISSSDDTSADIIIRCIIVFSRFFGLFLFIINVVLIVKSSLSSFSSSLFH